MSKRPGKPAHRLGTYGERVGRERAARRRAARAKAGNAELPPLAEDAATKLSVDTGAAGPEIVEIPQSDLANELSVLAALIMAGMVRSHPEARRRFRDDGIAVNDVPVISDKAKLRPSDISPEGHIKLSLGAAQTVLLRPV